MNHKDQMKGDRFHVRVYINLELVLRNSHDFEESRPSKCVMVFFKQKDERLKISLRLT